VNMELVADTNVIVAAILRDGLTRRLIFNPELKLFAPKYVWEELREHRKELVGKIGLDEQDYEEAVKLIFSNISIIEYKTCKKFEAQACSISPDADDWPFLAVALWKGATLWSNDKRLKQQDEVEVCSTAELFKRISRR